MQSNEENVKAGPSGINRNIWKEAEIILMLEIFREENILSLFDGKRYKNAEIYKLVEKKMKEHGVLTKSAEQIKNKWKSLKSAYTNCVKHNSQSGADRKECDYFNLLEEILATRPSQNLEAVGLDVDISVETGITQDDISQYLETSTSGNTLHETSRTNTKVSKEGKSKSGGLDQEEFFRQQKLLIEEFFNRQQEMEERAAKSRSDDLKTILHTFTQAMENIVQTPSFAPPHPLGVPQYMPTVQQPLFQGFQGYSRPSNKKRASTSDPCASKGENASKRLRFDNSSSSEGDGDENKENQF